MAALASLPAMDWHAAQDHGAILDHNRRLTAQLIDMADTLALPLVTPRDAAKRGGSVMLRLPEDLPAPQVVAALRAQGITTDHRSQTLRLSPGIVTTQAGVSKLHAALTQLTHR
jgi:selenocysteine lyase/cysteine desulfurase